MWIYNKRVLEFISSTRFYIGSVIFIIRSFSSTFINDTTKTSRLSRRLFTTYPYAEIELFNRKPLLIFLNLFLRFLFQINPE